MTWWKNGLLLAAGGVAGLAFTQECPESRWYGAFGGEGTP